MAPEWAQFSVRDTDTEAVLEKYKQLRQLDCARATDPSGSSVPRIEPLAVKFQRLLEEVTRRVLPKKALPRGTRKPNHWWSPEIAEARRLSFKARRYFQRRRKKGAPDADEARKAYAASRKEVQLMIWRAKEGLWRELCGTVDNNPWGKPYKIVMATLKGRSPKMTMTPCQARAIVNHLFATTSPAVPPARVTPASVANWIIRGSEASTINSIDLELIKEAVDKIKPNKAPGLDAVPSEVVACVLRSHHEDLRDMIRDTMLRGTIPAAWKRARVVLIPKPGKDPDTPGAYRPISVLPALSKVWEYAVKGVIEKQIGRDPFHPAQFGFRRGMGTIEATLEVTSFAKDCAKKDRLCAMVTIDVENAFNSLDWDLILDELSRRGVSSMVRTVMRDYFKDRRVVVHTPHEHVEVEIMAGVPQGSVLGPFLWNLVYDDILKLLNSDRHMRAIAYADDLAMVISARDSLQLEEILACTMAKVKRWFERTGLRVALGKTEVILLAGQRSSKIQDFDVLGTPITSAEAVRYLGITLDCRRNFRCHLLGAAAKGDKLMGALASLLPNISGPSVHARRLYYSVWESIVLYAARSGPPPWILRSIEQYLEGRSGRP